MPKLTGVFSLFKDLDKIPVADITRWIGDKSHIKLIENFIGNRVIYPQTIAFTREDIEIDFAILREALTRQPEILYNKSEKKIVITQDLEARFPPMQKLITLIIETINPKELTQIFLKSPNLNNLIGSVFAPPGKIPGETVKFKLGLKEVTAKKSTITFYPYKDHHLTLQFPNSNPIAASGGELGFVLDLR